MQRLYYLGIISRQPQQSDLSAYLQILPPPVAPIKCMLVKLSVNNRFKHHHPIELRHG